MWADLLLESVEKRNQGQEELGGRRAAGVARGGVGWGGLWGWWRAGLFSSDLSLATSAPELPSLLSPLSLLPRSGLFCLSPLYPQHPKPRPATLGRSVGRLPGQILTEGKWSLEDGSQAELPGCVALSKSLEPL